MVRRAGLLLNRRTLSDVIFRLMNYSLLMIGILLTLYPVIYVFSASFSDPLSILQGDVWLLPKGFNLNAYKRVLRNADIMTGYRNSIIYTLVGTAINLLMTTLAAFPLSRKRLPGKNVITLFILFTMFFSGGLIPSFITYQQLGLYNNLAVMVLPGAISVYNLIIMRSFFQNSIPEELYEAAYMDGATNFQTLTRIVVPLSKPIFAVMLMYYGISHWNAYFNAMIYLGDRDRFPLQLIMRELLIKDEMGGMMSEGGETMVEQILLSESLKYAVIVAASLPALVIYPFLQKYFVKGVMIGAIKG